MSIESPIPFHLRNQINDQIPSTESRQPRAAAAALGLFCVQVCVRVGAKST